jgi:anion-transporting  ArsA/GET3 family ATPase
MTTASSNASRGGGVRDGSRLDVPASRRVLMCVGPGGVGKTTVAAALGLAAAETGRRVIVVTIDPSRRLAQALGLSAEQGSRPGTVVRVPGLEDRGVTLDCLLLDTQRVFDEIVRAYSRDDETARRMLDNPIYRATVQHLGGALEYAATARVHMLHKSGDYDLIIVDTPPTANAIEFLEAPARISEIMTNPAAKFLAGSGRLGMKFFGLAGNVMLKAFESLGGGPFIGDLGRFLGDFGGVIGEFQRRAGDVADLLSSSDTGVVLATSASEFSVREAKAFLEVLRARGLRIDGVVLNRVDAPCPEAPPREELYRVVADRLDASVADAATDRILEVYAGARVQGARATKAEADLEHDYPDVPVCPLLRRSPPPTTLGELREMGQALWPVEAD